MGNRIKVYVAAIITVLGIAAAAPAVVRADAVGKINEGVTAIGGDEGKNKIGLASRIQTIVKILLYVLGAVAVVMIVIGGIRYATANGNQSTITAAKDTVLYAIIGIIVALLAYAIVNFVIDRF